ncbi:hypothetical protein FRC18_006431 [Serendipita sp. 400]|nr:hypothetical protein FRC18_006431 [Serendipita sp. 400]
MEELIDHEYKPSNIKAHSSVDALFLFSSFVASKQQITHLAGQLFFHIQEYHKIKECLKNRCDTSSGPTPGPNDMRMMARRAPPIYRCPNEVLACIFEAISEDGSHLMQPLLLVNKRFHHVVMDYPRLWTKIFLCINDSLEEVNQLSEPYIKTCLLRSMDVPLDIRLDYHSIGDADAFLWTNMRDSLIQCLGGKEKADEFVSSIDIFGLGCPLYEQRLDHALNLISLLTDPDQEKVSTQRWGSLVVSLPRSNIFAGIRIWETITKMGTPKLHTLVIYGDDGYADFSFQDVEGWDDWGSPPEVFPDLSTVVHLSIKDVTAALVPVNLTLLKSLDIQLNLNHKVLSHCKFIQELTIGCTEYPRISPDHATVIQLPLLTSLTLIGKLALLELFTFQLPRLDKLCLSRPTDLYVPSIKAPHVQLISDPTTVKSVIEETDYLALLATFSAIISLEIQVDNTEISKRYYATLCTIQREGLLPNSLRSIEVKGIGFVNLTIENEYPSELSCDFLLVPSDSSVPGLRCAFP